MRDPTARGLCTALRYHHLLLRRLFADLLFVMADIPYGPVVGTSQDPLAGNTPEAASLPVRTLSYPPGSPGVVLGGGPGRQRRMYPARIPAPLGAPATARTEAEGVADFVSARALEMYTDSLEQERNSLSIRKVRFADSQLKRALGVHELDSRRYTVCSLRGSLKAPCSSTPRTL